MKRALSTFPALLAALLLVLAPAVQARAGLLGKEMTIRDENKMGHEFDIMLRSKMAVVGDTYITDYIRDVVARVVTGKKPMPFTVRSAVIANPMLNAFAVPGGYIYIFTGLIEAATSECQLAGVIAHELGHVSQRHVAKRMEKQKTVSLLSGAGILAGILLGVTTGGGSGAAASQALMIGSTGAATAAMLQYSQEDEREADTVGFTSMVKAGYNPKGMPEMFTIMLKNRWYDTSSQIPSYLATHPGTRVRINYLNDRIKRLPPSLLDRKDDNTRLFKVQALVRAKLTPVETAMSYYEKKPQGKFTALDYMARAVIYSRMKQMDKAEQDFTTALNMDHNEPIILREAGIFYFKGGNFDRAYPLLQAAVIKNKRDALGLFYLARLQAHAKQYDRAIANMRRTLDLVPEDWEVHHFMGMIMGESGDTFGGNLHLAYEGVYSMNNRKARQFRDRAEKLAKTKAQKDKIKYLDQVMQERAKIKH